MIRISLITVVVAGLFVTAPIIFSQMAMANIHAEPGYLVENLQEPDEVLEGIQGKIYGVFVQSIMQKQDAPIAEMHQKLAESYAQSPQNLILYWQSYLNYYEGIFHMQAENDEAAEASIKAG
ncbi:MAG: hypothetical protein AAFV07_07760, partial [Bacteroidota bacterium]